MASAASTKRPGTGNSQPLFKQVQTFTGHTDTVRCSRFGNLKSGEKLLATGADDLNVNIWQIGGSRALTTLSGHTSLPTCLAFDHLEKYLAVGCRGGGLQLWNMEMSRVHAHLTGHRTSCECVEFHPYGDFFASGSLDTNMKIWDTRRHKCIQTYRGHTMGINCVQFSPHGRWVVTAGQEGVVKLWDLTAGKLMKDFTLHKGAVTQVEFHPDEFFLATASADRTVKIWNLETLKCVGSTDLESVPSKLIKFYPAAQSLLSATHDRVRIYSLSTMQINATFDVNWSSGTGLATTQTQGHNSQATAVSGAAIVRDLQFADEHTVLAASSENVTGVLWEGNLVTAQLRAAEVGAAEAAKSGKGSDFMQWKNGSGRANDAVAKAKIKPKAARPAPAPRDPEELPHFSQEVPLQDSGDAFASKDLIPRAWNSDANKDSDSGLKRATGDDSSLAETIFGLEPSNLAVASEKQISPNKRVGESADMQATRKVPPPAASFSTDRKKTSSVPSTGSSSTSSSSGPGDGDKWQKKNDVPQGRDGVAVHAGSRGEEPGAAFQGANVWDSIGSDHAAIVSCFRRRIMQAEHIIDTTKWQDPTSRAEAVSLVGSEKIDAATLADFIQGVTKSCSSSNGATNALDIVSATGLLQTCASRLLNSRHQEFVATAAIFSVLCMSKWYDTMLKYCSNELEEKDRPAADDCFVAMETVRAALHTVRLEIPEADLFGKRLDELVSIRSISRLKG